jgi:integrase
VPESKPVEQIKFIKRSPDFELKWRPNDTMKTSATESRKTEEKQDEKGDQNLRDSIIQWLRASAPKNTQNSYQTYKKQFKEFCEKRNLPHFPTRPEIVAAFMRYLHEERHLAQSTINKLAVAAVADEYKFTGIPAPTKDPLVKATKAVIGRLAKPPKAKEPFTKELFDQMIIKATDKYVDIRDIFMFMIMMKAMLRESEAVALKKNDVWIEQIEVNGQTEEVLFVFVEKSKTDQERRGHTIVLAASDECRARCPIAWFKMYTVTRNGSSEFLFHKEKNDQKLSDKTPNHRLKSWLHRIGEKNPQKFGSHSMRKGGATAAAESGIEERLIKKHGNWRSDAVYVYIKESLHNRLRVSRAIL